MPWNWQQEDWPDFRWDANRLAASEERFLLGTGIVLGAVRHLGEDQRQGLVQEAMSVEALTTSEIEGEVLNRASVQSSIQRHMGLKVDKRRVTPAEEGIAEMMVSVYRNYDQPLTEELLVQWHSMMTKGRRDLIDVGRHRTSPEPMQVVSGAIGRERIHFEGPPSKQVPAEMRGFLRWFRRTGPQGKRKDALPAITRAGIAHLYFESIHPFEDGNGRIGRAISEKAIAESVGQPMLLGLATAILKRQREYYDAIERANKKNEVTDWLVWFAGIALDAQQRTIAQTEFLIAKAKLMDRLRGQINDRQHKALLRMLREGPDGFKGGMSAGNYATITGASPATTTRDLADLVEKGVLTRSGERRHARYALQLPQ
jgi:Fic family protein